MLTSRSSKQENRFEEFENILDEAKKETESITPDISNQIDDLMSNNIMEKSKESLNQTTKEINKKNISAANNKSKDAKKNIRNNR